VVDRDVAFARIATIDHCLGRIADVGGSRRATLLPADVEEIVLLNLQRAVQAAIDLAAHVVASEGYGLPSSLATNFTLLEQHGVIEPDLAERLRRMTGFRNIAIHQYEVLDQRIIESIVQNHLGDLRELCARIAVRFNL
jgi:uncharacterized protein YutE (UPF0331/DUF86 family)